MTAQGIRARNREALMAAIIETANDQLTQVGPSELSVRAIARSLGMASSAIYRYVQSRDELLTILILDGYNSMADAVEAAAARHRDPRRRFLAVGHACRMWAVSHQHSYALIYGSPVPGYAAPQDTIGPATRIPALLVEILQHSDADPAPAAFNGRVAKSMRPLLNGLQDWVEDRSFSDAAMAIGLMAWTHIIGAISFELFGHRHNVIGDSENDRKAFFEFELQTLADLLGL